MKDDENLAPIFGKVLCPHCKKPTVAKSFHPLLDVPGVRFAGFVFIFPLTAKYHCPEHGELKFEDFPSGSSRNFWLRRLVFIGIGSIILAGLIGALIMLLIAKANRDTSY